MVNGFAVCAFGLIINHYLMVPHTGSGTIVGLVYQEKYSSAEICLLCRIFMAIFLGSLSSASLL